MALAYYLNGDITKNIGHTSTQLVLHSVHYIDKTKNQKWKQITNFDIVRSNITWEWKEVQT